MFPRKSSLLARRSAGLMVAAILAGTAMGWADVVLPSIISDHMVLQSAAKVPIWGKAEPGEKVAVTLGVQTASAIADGNGRWRVTLHLEGSAPGPFEMSVKGSNTVKVSDVMVGEVWVAGGQSNMEFTLDRTIGGAQEIARPANPFLRQFCVERNAVPDPEEDCKGRWIVASPETSGKFTGVGYYFAGKLQAALRKPVGLLNSNWGGTACEPWTSADGLEKCPELKPTKDRLLPRMRDYLTQKDQFASAFGKWVKKNQREDLLNREEAAYSGENVPMEGWRDLQVPGEVSPMPGVFWIRNEVTLGPENVLEKLGLQVGEIPGFEAIYWNGSLVEELTPANIAGPHSKREYRIPTRLLKVGRNVMAIRIYAPGGGVVLKDAPMLKVGAPGQWKGKMQHEFAPLGPESLAQMPQPPAAPANSWAAPSFLFNGMIHPLIPYAIKGVIWYQGESNANRAAQYRTAFPVLIEDWRTQWGQGDFAFYFCQLANYQPKKSEPAESTWAELRESQAISLRVPHTGQAVLIDIGEAGDIHPRNKKDAGERLALIALAKDYGIQTVFTGPTFQTAKAEGSAMRITFGNAEGGLQAKPLPGSFDVKSLFKKTAPLKRNSPQSQLEGFAICGEDRKWVWADALIEGETVVVSSEKVPHPVAVRYAWADNPTANLVNGSGLPASPFRTDEFPLSTANAKY